MAKMSHPDSSLTVDAAPDAQAMYASQGWTRDDHKTPANVDPGPVNPS